MPRRQLAKISGNRAVNYELSPYLRGKVVRLYELGQSYNEIRDTLNLIKSTVKYTLDKSTSRNEGKSLIRIDRPKSYIERVTRRIIYFV